MKTVKELVWHLDRKIWAHVPDGGQTEPWTTSKAREESNKVIQKFIDDRLQEKSEMLDQIWHTIHGRDTHDAVLNEVWELFHKAGYEWESD